MYADAVIYILSTLHKFPFAKARDKKYILSKIDED